MARGEIGWGVQAPPKMIEDTINVLAPRLNTGAVFDLASKGAIYHLRCIVCYFGHHYKAYALSEELEEWLLFDDSTISAIGSWRDVKSSLISSKMQPNLLFYEQQQA